MGSRRRWGLLPPGGLGLQWQHQLADWPRLGETPQNQSVCCREPWMTQGPLPGLCPLPYVSRGAGAGTTGPHGGHPIARCIWSTAASGGQTRPLTWCPVPAAQGLTSSSGPFRFSKRTLCPSSRPPAPLSALSL